MTEADLWGSFGFMVKQFLQQSAASFHIFCTVCPNIFFRFPSRAYRRIRPKIQPTPVPKRYPTTVRPFVRDSTQARGNQSCKKKILSMVLTTACQRQSSDKKLTWGSLFRIAIKKPTALKPNPSTMHPETLCIKGRTAVLFQDSNHFFESILGRSLF